MNEFCKIFNSEEYGQILVLIEICDDKYEVNFIFVIDGGTAKVGLSGFKTLENAERTFSKIDLDMAENMAQSVHDNF